METETLYWLGFALIAIGTATLAVTIFLLSRTKNREQEEHESQAGGILIIGPIPIIFGKNRKAVRNILLLSIILTAILLAITLVNYLDSR